MSVVIDASVALKWVLDEAGREAADALLEEELIAPSLWLLEAANALWRRTQRGEISGEEARERLTELFNAPVTTATIEDDLPAAAALANVLGHPVYDCLYLAMAFRESTYVVTADIRFHAIVNESPTLKGTVRLLEA
ncbi:type II toxin-antitoxin system VapC family toxin [Phenylobacterium sp.]|uniref:type II toxin-antitoxin system VapC family toxin n=1 Tax=Phenylobacterium sp. TaxID=1871053 RepID=UPI00286CE6B3|nr:type II toxin-antitoxin system VapC family toxin [Phenylobacterium sp.]